MNLPVECPILTYVFYPNIKVWKAELKWPKGIGYKYACALGTSRAQAEKRLIRYAIVDNSIEAGIVQQVQQLMMGASNANLPATLDGDKETISNSGWTVLQREINQKDKSTVSQGKE